MFLSIGTCTFPRLEPLKSVLRIESNETHLSDARLTTSERVKVQCYLADTPQYHITQIWWRCVVMLSGLLWLSISVTSETLKEDNFIPTSFMTISPKTWSWQLFGRVPLSFNLADTLSIRKASLVVRSDTRVLMILLKKKNRHKKTKSYQNGLNTEAVIFAGYMMCQLILLPLQLSVLRIMMMMINSEANNELFID